jgi:hypothetical protein
LRVEVFGGKRRRIVLNDSREKAGAQFRSNLPDESERVLVEDEGCCGTLGLFSRQLMRARDLVPIHHPNHRYDRFCPIVGAVSAGSQKENFLALQPVETIHSCAVQEGKDLMEFGIDLGTLFPAF